MSKNGNTEPEPEWEKITDYQQRMQKLMELGDQKDKECEYYQEHETHDWHAKSDEWRLSIRCGSGMTPTLRIPVMCISCGLQGEEVHIYSCIVDDFDRTHNEDW